METLDPVWVWIARLTLAVLFAAAGLSKLWHPAAYRTAIAAYALLPAPVVAPAAILLAAAEVAAAVLLLWPAGAVIGAALLWALLLLFSVAIGINLRRGRTDIDCGCWMFGTRPETPHGSIGPGTLLRNAALAALVLVAVLPASERALSVLDWSTVLMGTLAALGLFAMAAQLSMNSRRLTTLRTTRS
jgi:Methylamine utilisation protein MauE